MKYPQDRPSLREVYRSVSIPDSKSFWRKMLAYAGPGYLVSVGYMDPGNWATDIAGGSKFGYTLLSVIMLSNSLGNLAAISLCALGGGNRARLGASLPRLFQRQS